MKKYLIITGGSKGIGLAAARLFTDNNYQAINISRNDCNIVNVINLNTDLLSGDWQDSLSAKIREIIQEPAQIILVHNAALLEKDDTTNLKADSFRKVMELNIIVPSILNQILLPLMDRKSAILYIGSTLSEKAVKGACSYVTSKHALIGLMRATCQDLAGTGIHTACICPGFTDTEMLRKHLNHDQQILQAITSVVCENRLIEPNEIAEIIYICAENPVINGSVIHANLGQIER